MIQVEQAAQLEADKRGAEVGGNAEQVEEQEMNGREGTVWHVLYKRLNYVFDIILTSTYSEKPGLLMVVWGVFANFQRARTHPAGWLPDKSNIAFLQGGRETSYEVLIQVTIAMGESMTSRSLMGAPFTNRCADP